MKKIFVTTLFWFLVFFLFRAYIRLFDKPLGRQVASWFTKSQQVCFTGSIFGTGITDQLQDIQKQLDLINKRLESENISVSTPISQFETTTPTQVVLYYFNQKEDQKLPPEQQANINSLQPISRTLPPSKDILKATIDELLKGTLTSQEKNQGFITEFPNPKFRLLASQLAPDGTLTLEFTEVPGFTSGGSTRMGILANSIIKTAMQFSGVKKVVFIPETLFQP